MPNKNNIPNITELTKATLLPVSTTAGSNLNSMVCFPFGSSKAFQLNLVGVVSDDVIESIYSKGLKNHVRVVGYVSHDEAIKFQMKSQLLLLIEIDSEDTKAIIPGKVFEYLISETPILAIGPNEADVEKIIKSTNTGTYFTYVQKPELKLQLLNYFRAYQNNELSVNAIGLQPYSRKALTEKLSKIISNK